MESGHSTVTAAGIHFPFEIWTSILQLLCACGQEHAACAARVHPAFLNEAESILYRNPHITSIQQAVKFENTISRSALRCAAVRELHITVSQQDFQRSPEYVNLMRRLLGRLLHLVTLKFRRSPKSADTRFLHHSITLPILVADSQIPIKRLRGELVPLSSRFFRFLNAHPELEEVRLAGAGQPAFEHLASFSDLNLPNLQALGCDHRLAMNIWNPWNITHLYLTEDRSQTLMLPHIIHIFGAQLVSLRVDFCPRVSETAKGLDYPTLRDYRWEDCLRLKFLHIDDGPLSPHRLRPPARPRNNYNYGIEERKKARLPPVLETFVWASSWARPSPSSDPQHGHRRAIQRFSEAVLKDITSVLEVIYLWSMEEYFHCSLSHTGEWMERRADPREADDDTWAKVR